MDRIESLFEKSKSVLGEKKAKSLWLAYTAETDLNKRREIEGFLHGLLSKKLDETFQKKKILLDTTPETASGPFKLGQIISGDRDSGQFGLSDHQLNQHLGIWGMTGSGKTNIVYLIATNLMKSGENFLIFDWKRNFRDLLQRKIDDLQVYTVGRNISPFYWNPLIPPPETDPSVWLKQFIEVCQHALFLGHGVERLLQKVFDNLYQKYRVYAGQPEGYPTLEEAQEILENYKTKGREGQWLDSTKRAIGALCFGGIGEVLNVRNNSELELNQNIVFEVDSLTDSEKTFFAEIILLWIYHKRLTEPDREKFKHLVVIEEAHHILFREKQKMAGKETITDMILRQIRELGEGIIVIDQQPSLITPTALANIHTHVAMKMFYPDDVSLTAKLLNLNWEDSDYLRMLQTGWGIVKVPDWHKPFLVKFDYFPLQKGLITDQRLANSLYEADSIERGYQRLKEELDRVAAGIRSLVNTGQFESDLTPNEWRLLADVGKYPFSGMVERYGRLGMNVYQGNKAKLELIQMGFVTEESLSGPTGQLKLLDLTELGIAKAREQGNEPNLVKQNSSLAHEYWKHIVKIRLQHLGFAVQDEVGLNNGHAVDLVAEREGERIAVEIETGKSDFVNNVLKDLEDGFDSVICLSLKKSLMRKLRAGLASFGAFDDSRLSLLYVGDMINNSIMAKT